MGPVKELLLFSSQLETEALSANKRVSCYELFSTVTDVTKGRFPEVTFFSRKMFPER